jgi:hypothetical protein
MLLLNTLLQSEGIDPQHVVVLRHRPMEPSIRRLLPWIAMQRPDLLDTYQQTQWVSLEKALTRAKIMASFIGQEAGKAVFVGLYRVGIATPLNQEQYWKQPGNVELRSLGMIGFKADRSEVLSFDLEPLEALQEWKGRLIVRWPPPERSWWRWAGRNQIPVWAITEENSLDAPMPPWEELILSWAELRVLPQKWRIALSQWRGVYLIFDVRRAAGYVGSAFGAENLLGRWLTYASSGHGGNKQLRQSQPENLRFSILQRTSPDLDPKEVMRIEGNWKNRLHTRSHGLNEN